ncbi:MAG: hypothetical protein SFU85_00110 [Candidatus Methylacidiphilales bacterium]|nr:hypothetical protein [Candidatus Methylacidiphilales bacterium]
MASETPAAKEAKPGPGNETAASRPTPVRDLRRPRVTLKPVPVGQNRASWKTPAAIVGILAFLVISAVSIYLLNRETILDINVEPGQYQLQPKAFVVFNFAGKTSMLKRDFLARQAPLLEQLDQQREQLASAKSDLASRQQRRDLLSESSDQLQKEIPQILERSQKELDQFWEKQGMALKEEYNSFRDSLHQEIQDRAKQLGLKYQKNLELDAIEVAANAFRLSLYNAPTGVAVDEQRKWSEALLKRWNEFEKKWNDKQLELKNKAIAIKQEPGPQVAAAQERIEQLRSEIAALDIELGALRDEVATYEQRLQEARQALEDTVAPFLRELLNVPGDFEKMTLDLPADGHLLVRDVQERTELPPGEYTLLVRGLLQDDEYWAVRDFTVLEYKKNDIQVLSTDFKPARDYLIPKDK